MHIAGVIMCQILLAFFLYTLFLCPFISLFEGRAQVWYSTWWWIL